MLLWGLLRRSAFVSALESQLVFGTVSFPFATGSNDHEFHYVSVESASPHRGRSQVSTASCASGQAKRGARGRTCRRAYDNGHYVSRRNFTGHRFPHSKRADYVMPDYQTQLKAEPRRIQNYTKGTTRPKRGDDRGELRHFDSDLPDEFDIVYVRRPTNTE